MFLPCGSAAPTARPTSRSPSSLGTRQQGRLPLLLQGVQQRGACRRVARTPAWWQSALPLEASLWDRGGRVRRARPPAGRRLSDLRPSGSRTRGSRPRERCGTRDPLLQLQRRPRPVPRLDRRPAGVAAYLDEHDPETVELTTSLGSGRRVAGSARIGSPRDRHPPSHVRPRARSGRVVRRSAAQGGSARPARGRPRADVGRAVGGDHPRHDRPRDPLRRRRGDGRRPPRHRGLHDRQPPHREGLRRRRLLRRRHRRRRGPRGRDGQALPGAARALREDRGRDALARGQGQPARPDGAQQPARPRCRASWSSRCSPATTTAATGAGCSATTPPAASTRRPTSRPTGRVASTPATGSRQSGAKDMARDEDVDLALPGRCSPPPTRTPRPAAPTSSGGSSRRSR